MASKSIETATMEISVEDFDFPSSNAEVKILYRGETIVGNVVTEAMALVCKPWKNFFFDPRSQFTEAANAEDTVERRPAVDFTEDNAEALLILLRIAHLRFDKIPADLNYETLVEIAILCDQYDCAPLVKPWLMHCLKDEERISIQSGHERWLWVAWTFGRLDVFRTLAEKAFRNITIDEDGQYLDSAGLPMPPLPPGILESILEYRLNAIDSLLAIPYNILEKYESSTEDLCTVDHACDVAIYGSVARHLHKAGLWPCTSVKEMRTSVQDVVDCVQEITIKHTASFHQRYSYSCSASCHCASNYNFANLSVATLASVGSPVLESHMRHMSAEFRHM